MTSRAQHRPSQREDTSVSALTEQLESYKIALEEQEGELVALTERALAAEDALNDAQRETEDVRRELEGEIEALQEQVKSLQEEEKEAEDYKAKALGLLQDYFVSIGYPSRPLQFPSRELSTLYMHLIEK